MEKRVSSGRPLSPLCGRSFLRQPARVLLVEAVPPWWLSTGPVLCEALENVLTLASSVEGPSRIPLLSVYAVSRQRECLLPFVSVRGNLLRLHSCVEEVRSLPTEGCVRTTATRAQQLSQGVLDCLQQFKLYQRHSSNANSQANDNCSVEVTVVSSQLGRSVVRLIEQGLRGADLMSLKRLLLVHIESSTNGTTDEDSTPAPEDPCPTEAEDSHVLGTEVDLQQVDNSVLALETFLKSWLHEQGGDQEHLQLLLPSPRNTAVCVKCDMQERLVSPALIALTPPLGAKTETSSDFLQGKANQSAAPQRLKAIKVLRADGLCESLLYGLPLLLRPSSCWSLDWDEMESNHNLFHALCHTLRSQELFLLLQSDSSQSTTPAGATGVYSHFVLQPSPSLSLLLKPVVSRELLLPCPMSLSTQDPPTEAQRAIQACVGQLEEEFMFNPLLLNSNLYSHLRSRGLISQSRHPYKVQPAQKNQAQPLEGSKSTGSRQPRQGRQSGAHSKVRATVAPLPSSSASASSLGPPPAKACRPALTLLSSSNSGAHRRAPRPRAPAPTVSTERSVRAQHEEDDLNRPK